MVLARAVYDKSSKKYFGEPFKYMNAAMVDGSALNRDLEIYLRLASRIGMMPTAPSLLFFGSEAEHLFLRRNGNRDDWHAFVSRAKIRSPTLAARTSELTAVVTGLATGSRSGAARRWLPSMAEICVGAALLAVVPPGVKIIADAALPGGRDPTGHVRRCDFHLVSHRREMRVEVAGLISSNGLPLTIDGVAYAELRLPARRSAYTTLGLSAPVEVFADQILDNKKLLEIVEESIKGLA